MKILALIPYPIDKGPSQRFRLGIYLPYLKDRGIDMDCHPFYDDRAWTVLYQKGKYLQKIKIIFFGFFNRFRLLLKIKHYESVYIQREITPIGPPILAWIITKVLGKKVIFDYDDAIWMPNYTKENALFHRLKAYWKVKYLIKWSQTVLAGNQFLKEYGQEYNRNVFLVPTCVDTERMHNPSGHSNREDVKTIGWTGTISTMHHLDIIFPILDALSLDYEFEFMVISNKKPSITRPYLRFLEWSPETEIEDLMQIDLGIMPLKHDFQFAQGKCGFKLIQYMALGKKVLASPIGVNSSIISHGKNGFLCNNKDEWRMFFEKYLNQELPNTGLNAREDVIQKYSVKSSLNLLTGFFLEYE